MDSEKQPEMLANSSSSNGKAPSAIPESQIPTRICTPTKEMKEKDVDTQTLPAASGRCSPKRYDLTRRQRLISRFQYGTLCYTLFIVGWNDGSTGPLIPRMREVYNVGYTVVSVIFVLSCIGFIIGALVNVWLQNKLGFGKTLVLGCTMQIVVYSIQAAAPPFPVFAIFNGLNGVGLALQDAQANGFVGSLSRHRGTKMNILQAFYGLGGLVAPFVSTQFANMERWSFHYLVTLGLILINLTCQITAFRFKRLDEALKDGGEEVLSEAGGSEGGRFGQIMRNKNVHLLGFFMLAYVGAGVTIGGWIVTYIIEVRNGGPSSGYIASGFYGGITLSRVVLVPLNRWVGERRIQFVYIALTLAFELVIWFVPNLGVNAAMVALIGLVFGPMYPITISVAARILPRQVFLGGVGWIAGFGQAGSAAVPFITGAIAQKYGIKNLHPTVMAMLGVMTILLFLTPDRPSPNQGASEKEDVERPSIEKEEK
ncbi:MFS general substrate transporter [Coprinellus micaceus]|uniref:MFS general substrate transporter n=1 Tax=Coprinellus micaceus TaxID=71717 RepID=A0A4Y7TJ54_COPMI|nr:MFS general substrate transporter [Coprinellus micaceus]